MKSHLPDLKWYHYLLMVVWFLSSFRPSSYDGPAELAGGLTGAVIGVYLLVAVLTVLARKVRGIDTDDSSTGS